jgi:hypothetical protein
MAFFLYERNLDMKAGVLRAVPTKPDAPGAPEKGYVVRSLATGQKWHYGPPETAYQFYDPALKFGDYGWMPDGFSTEEPYMTVQKKTWNDFIRANPQYSPARNPAVSPTDPSQLPAPVGTAPSTTLVVKASPGGWVNLPLESWNKIGGSEGGWTVQDYAFYPETRLMLVAEPSSGYRFDRWIVDQTPWGSVYSSTSNPLTLKLGKEGQGTTVTVYFVQGVSAPSPATMTFGPGSITTIVTSITPEGTTITTIQTIVRRTGISGDALRYALSGGLLLSAIIVWRRR